MLMVLLVFSFVLPAPDCKNPVSSLMTSPRPNGIELRVASFNMKPEWKAVASTDGHTKSTHLGDETNLEQWRNSVQTVKIEDLAPRKAMPITAYSRVSLYHRFTYQAMFIHAPWYLTVQQHWPDCFGTEPVLYYDLVKSPTLQKPYYEAVVCPMPNIRCRAKTIELLQEQLLKQYSEYLAKMLQDEEDFPTRQQEIRPGDNGLNGTFIAWIIGATHQQNEKKPEIIRVFSFTTAVDY
jgi:hypothetical protein